MPNFAFALLVDTDLKKENLPEVGMCEEKLFLRRQK
jgi:hypothetical protein